MSGWFRCEADVWPTLVASLPMPWPEDVVYMDLRWLVDQDDNLPSRTDLAKRWGWTRDEVRTPLRHPERWWDPIRGPAPTSREALTQRDPARPRLTQRDPAPTDEPRESGTPDPARPRLTQADPTVPQRVGSHLHLHPHEEDPPTPAARGPLAASRASWVADTALAELQRLDHDRAASKAAQWERREVAEVARITDSCRAGKGRTPAYPHAPSGLTRKEVAEGLSRAARRWRSEHGPPGDERATNLPTSHPEPPP